MLVLTRKLQESIVIEGGIIVKVLGIDETGVKIGIHAPKELRVDRSEIATKRAARRERVPTTIGLKGI